MINLSSNLKLSVLSVYVESVSAMTLGMWASQILENVMMVETDQGMAMFTQKLGDHKCAQTL